MKSEVGKFEFGSYLSLVSWNLVIDYFLLLVSWYLVIVCFLYLGIW
jgi:hypothetical protein